MGRAPAAVSWVGLCIGSPEVADGGWKCGRKEDKEESISGGWPREGEEGAVGAWTHSTGEPEHTFDLGLSCLPREAEFTLQAISMHY